MSMDLDRKVMRDRLPRHPQAAGSRLPLRGTASILAQPAGARTRRQAGTGRTARASRHTSTSLVLTKAGGSTPPSGSHDDSKRQPPRSQVQSSGQRVDPGGAPCLSLKSPAKCLTPIRASSVSTEPPGPLHRRLLRLRRVVHPVRGRLPQRAQRAGTHHLHSAEPRLRRHLRDDRTRRQPPNRLRRKRNPRRAQSVHRDVPQLRRRVRAPRRARDGALQGLRRGVPSLRAGVPRAARRDRLSQPLLLPRQHPDRARGVV